MELSQIPRRLRSCLNCRRYESDCKTRLATWYAGNNGSHPRGLKPCPQWIEQPLSDTDY